MKALPFYVRHNLFQCQFSGRQLIEKIKIFSFAKRRHSRFLCYYGQKKVNLIQKHWKFNGKSFLLCHTLFTEPVGSVKPNVNIGDKTNLATVKLTESISLLCPAQAFPMPAFRYFWVSTLNWVKNHLKLIRKTRADYLISQHKKRQAETIIRQIARLFSLQSQSVLLNRTLI